MPSQLESGHYRVLLMIRSLHVGGSEKQLTELAIGLKERGHTVTVASLYPGGKFSDTLRKAGIEPIYLNKAGRWDIFRCLYRVIKLIRSVQPDILFSSMPAPNIFSAIAALLFPKLKVIWRFGSFVHAPSTSNCVAYFNDFLIWLLSFRADLIFSNSNGGVQHLVSQGIRADKIQLLRNGYDINQFTPDAASGAETRRKLSISSDSFLVGMVGRLYPVKDHATWFESLALITKDYPTLRSLIVGDGPAEQRATLTARAESLGITDRLIWLSHSDQMPSIYNALDALVLCSISEGLPNVVAEAMACGIPAITTDVGDCRWLVGDTGQVIQSGRPEQLAEAVKQVLDSNRERPSAACRQRIVSELGRDILIDKVLSEASALFGV